MPAQHIIGVHHEAMYADLFPAEEDAFGAVTRAPSLLRRGSDGGDGPSGKGAGKPERRSIARRGGAGPVAGAGEDARPHGNSTLVGGRGNGEWKRVGRGASDKAEKDEDISDLYDKLIHEKALVMQEVDSSLAKSTTHARRRKQTLHREWNDNIFSRIKAGIDDEMSQHHRQAKEEKRRHYESYLRNYSRKQGNVFLDVITKAEYNPLCGRHTSMKYDVELGDDPLQRGIFIDKDEQLVRTSGDTHSGTALDDSALCRAISVPKWLAIPMYDIDSFAHEHGRPSRRVNQLYNHSEIKQNPFIEDPLGKKHFHVTQQQETADFGFKAFEALPTAVVPEPPKFNR